MNASGRAGPEQSGKQTADSRRQSGRAARFAHPVEFVNRELGAGLWSKQAEILEAVRDHARVSVRSCNGSGKTYAAAHVVLWWLMCFTDAIVITTAPTEHQVRDVLWREIRRAHRRNEQLVGGKLLRTSLELGDKYYAQGLSTDSSERFQGFHEGHILFVVDEASGVREGIFEAIEGSMTSENARMLLLGNPTALTGTFFESFHGHRSLWRTLHISAFDTPNLRASEVVTPSLVTLKWVEDAEQNWGKESSLYQIRVLGEFPSEAEDALIPLKLIEQAVERVPKAEDDGDSGKLIEIGVDVARFGTDRTVICVRRGDQVVEINSFARQDTMQTVGTVIDSVRRHSPSAVRIDEVGIGAGVVDRLREQRIRGVVGVNVGRRSTRPEHFANLRAELYDGLRERFQQGRISIPGDADLIGELTSLRYLFTSSGQIRLEGKEELRARGDRSPDRADALMLAFATATRQPFRLWS